MYHLIAETEIGVLQDGAIHEFEHAQCGKFISGHQGAAVDERRRILPADQDRCDDNIYKIQQLLTEKQAVDSPAGLYRAPFTAKVFP